MTGARPNPQPDAPDADDTAELPAMDASAASSAEPAPDRTDSWKLVPQEQRELERAAEVGALRAQLAAMAEERIRLENSVRALTMNLRDREERLQEKSRQLELLARELQERDALILRLQQEAVGSAAALGELRSGLARVERDDAPLPRDLPARLLVRSDGGTEIVQVLGRRTLIGRGADCQLQIDAEYVSRRHALIVVTPEETVVEDLNSTNGVYVNGTRVARRRLAEGDNIVIGRTLFRYVLGPAIA